MRANEGRAMKRFTAVSYLLSSLLFSALFFGPVSSALFEFWSTPWFTAIIGGAILLLALRFRVHLALATRALGNRGQTVWHIAQPASLRRFIRSVSK